MKRENHKKAYGARANTKTSLRSGVLSLARKRTMLGASLLLPAAAAFGQSAGQPPAAAPAASSSDAQRGREAQQQQPQQQTATLPQVTVSAERRETKLQRTPVAVAVIGSSDIEKKSMSLLRDLAGQVPGLVLPQPFSPSLQYLYIRGIGTAAPTLNGAAGLYIDDVYIPRIINSGIFGLPDVERIEVLRGPQGTLYGQNTSAGAIKIVSRDPGDETTAWVATSVGSYGMFEAKGYASAPIKEGLLSASVAYAHNQTNGTVYNPALGHHVNAVHTDLGRVKFHLTPGDGWDAVLAIDGIRDRSDNGSYTRTNVPGWSERTTYDPRSLTTHTDGGGVTLHVSKVIDSHLTFKSITAYRGFTDKPDPWSYDGYPGNLYGWQLNLQEHQISQEFQLLGNYGRWTFTGGVAASREQFWVDRPNYTNNVYSGISSQTNVSNLGAYAQARYAITPALGVTAGIRYNVENDAYSWQAYKSNAAFEHLAQTASLNNLGQRTTAVTPKFGIDYQLTPNAFTYASITKGEKAGGYNPVAGALAVAQIPVDPEKVTAYEVGFKNSWLGGRAQTNLALFYNDYKDLQSAVQNPIVNGQVVNGAVTVNAGKAHTYGVEFDGKLQVTRDLRWGVTATALHASFIQFANPTGNPNADYAGNRLPNTPTLTLGTTVNYHVPVRIPGRLTADASVYYESYSFTDNGNTLKIPSHTDVDLDLVYQFPGRHWSVTFLARNLLNRVYPVSIASVPSYQIYGIAYNQPRTFTASLRYDF
ncbi:iron complex outermembrane receptor protein [Paraburkholderia sp. JPY465]|uniref:TonB-dependent receptor n=1 Tax=Paraburkholderia sp. JPY465 TaxID=3042285 RepID=UPI003D1B4736